MHSLVTCSLVFLCATGPHTLVLLPRFCSAASTGHRPTVVLGCLFCCSPLTCCLDLWYCFLCVRLIHYFHHYCHPTLPLWCCLIRGTVLVLLAAPGRRAGWPFTLGCLCCVMIHTNHLQDALRVFVGMCLSLLAVWGHFNHAAIVCCLFPIKKAITATCGSSVGLCSPG